ncbi:MAG: orotate phosphoribosyltransferase [Bacteroidota bacterium]
MDNPTSEIQHLKSKIAQDLLRIGAVALRPNDPFTWASRRRSPVYCDNRLTLGYPDIRTRIADGFTAHVAAMGRGADVIAGTATAGIPHAALVADRLGLPMAYVRAKPKAHGKENLIEGRIAPGQRVVVIEDLISTGGSSLAAAAAVRAAGADPVAVLAIFTYGFDEAQVAFDDAGIPLVTLTDFETLIAVAVESGALTDEQVVTLRNWRENAAAWSRVYGGA